MMRTYKRTENQPMGIFFNSQTERAWIQEYHRLFIKLNPNRPKNMTRKMENLRTFSTGCHGQGTFLENLKISTKEKMCYGACGNMWLKIM